MLLSVLFQVITGLQINSSTKQLTFTNRLYYLSLRNKCYTSHELKSMEAKNHAEAFEHFKDYLKIVYKLKLWTL